jgi:hypothetical protein
MIAYFELQGFQSLQLQLQALYERSEANFSGLDGFGEALSVKPTFPRCPQTGYVAQAKTQSLRFLDASQNPHNLQTVNAVLSLAQGSVDDSQTFVKPDGPDARARARRGCADEHASDNLRKI